MALKRSADAPAEGGEQRASSNPFAGLSLLGGTSPTSGFAAAAASTAVGFGASAAPSSGFGSFAAASAASTSAPSSGGVANPFAGVSLSAPSSSPGSLFTSAAAASNPTSFGFAAASTSAPSFGASAASQQSGNPFAGISLFSGSRAQSTASGGSGGGLFTSAASSLSSSAPAGGLFSSAANSLATPAAGKPASEEAPAKADASARGEGSTKSSGQKSSAAEEHKDSQQDSQDATGEEEEEVIFHTECKLWKLVKHAPASAADSGAVPDAPAGADGGDAPASGAAGRDVGATSASPDGAAAAESAATAGQENGWRWQEKGHGILHINRHARTGDGRLVMRMRGVLKLLLNTPIFPTTKYEKVGQKSVRFVGVDPEESDSKDGQAAWCAYRLNLLTSDQQGKFLAMLHEKCGVKSL